MIIDATNLIVGRLASFAAKQALLGEAVDIVNCEKAMMTGDRKWILKEYARKMQIGTYNKGPFTVRMPDRFVKRIIRGMLPYKQEKGRSALGRIKCYIGVPERFKDKKLETVGHVNISKVPNLKYISIGELCRHMGAKI